VNKHFVKDKAYEARVADLVMQALMLGLKDPVTNVCVWRTGEIVDVFMNIQAMLLAQSPVAGTPAKLREYAEDYAKALRRRTKAYQDRAGVHGEPFPSYHVEGDLH
jgi:hypothetical protein